MAIINHTHRFVFVHVPKNAGTSVSHYLSQLTTNGDHEIGATDCGEASTTWYRQRYRLSKHSTYREIEKAIGADTLSTYTAFAVVRDPYDRVRSMFRFLRRWRGWRQFEMYGQFRDEFYEYRGMNEFVASDFFRTPGPDRLFLPQVTWVADEPSRSLLVTRILRLESLGTDMARFVDDVGLPVSRLSRPLAQFNASDPGEDEDVLDDASRREIARRYELDFELLGYDPKQLGSPIARGAFTEPNELAPSSHGKALRP